MRHSTKPKHVNASSHLLMTPIILHPNEKVKRTSKIQFVLGDKETTLKEARCLQMAMIREAKSLLLLEEHKPRNLRNTYSVCKEYITAEEATKRTTERTDSNATYFEGMAGWVFWLQQNPSEEELFSMQYQQDILNEKQSPQLPEESNEAIDYG